MRTHRIVKWAGVIFTTYSLLLAVPVYAGFGISPAKVQEDNLIRGSQFDRVIYIVQGTPDKDLHVTATIADGDIKDWISVQPSDDFVIPKGTQQFPITIHIQVPKDAEMGIYRGSIRVGSVPDKATVEKGGSGVSISVGARIDINLNVGQGIHYEYAIGNIEIKNIKETEYPKASIRIENKGNVPAGPEEAAFELYNKFGDIRLAYVQGIKLAKAPAFQTSNLNPEFPVPVRLLPGDYWGTVRIYNADNIMIREFKNLFNVEKASFLDKYMFYVIIASGVLLLLIIIFLLGRRTGRRRR